MDFSCLIDYDILTFEELDSTNDEAKRLAMSGVSGNFVVFTRNQSAGRGQRGRNWESLPGNLHFSIMVQTDKELHKVLNLVFLSANAIANTIKQISKTDTEISVKWPNDVLVDEKKVAGILVETVSNGDKKFVIIGIGVNLNTTPDVPERPVTSIKESCGYSSDIESFLDIIVGNFHTEYLAWQKSENFDMIRAKWLSRAYMLNKVITVDNNQRRISGLFKDIDESGALVVELASGEICKLSYGEVIFDAR